MDIFIEISLVLVVATAIALIMQRLKQPLIIGHIISGILLGPVVFNLIKAKDTIEIFSQFGITILLFLVGLNLSPKVIREVGKVSFIAGLGQVIATTALGAAIGVALGFSLTVALFLGVALSFSSTIIITKALSDKKDLTKLYGKISIGMLLVQDVIAVFLLIALVSLQQQVGISTALLWILGKGAVAIGLVLVIGFYVLPFLTKLFAESQEFLFLFAIGWGLGIAALFHAVGFTAEIGALVAGIALAASPYHFEISSKMKMLRDFFLVLFFVLLGAQLSFSNIAAVWKPALAFSLFMLIADPLITFAFLAVLGYTRKTSFFTGLTMASISEFSFLLVLFAIRADVLPAEMLTMVTIVGLVTIAASTYLFRYSGRLFHWLEPVLAPFERAGAQGEARGLKHLEAVLFGYHRVGVDFLPSLQKLKLPYMVVDFDPETIHHLTEKNIPCRYGDAEDDEFLNELSLSKLKLLVSTVPDYEANAFLVNKLRKKNKTCVAIMIAHTVDQAKALYDAGATYVIMPHFLGGNYASLLIQKYGANIKKFESERKRHMSHLLSKTGA
ncbi:MAG: cation:proton antiporter [bacterium]|nr:cation:proton antiporter [bacterium]